MHFLVATAESEVVAFARYRFSARTWGLACEVETLVVTEVHRGSGVGHQLMRRIESLATTSGASGMRVNVFNMNDRGRTFYESLGYDPVAVRYAKQLEDFDAGRA